MAPLITIPQPYADIVFGWLSPTNFTLAGLLAFVLYVVIKAQQRADFDFGRMLKGDNDKESFFAFAGMVSLASSTWALMVLALQGAVSERLFTVYLAAWSGSAALARLIDAWVALKNDPDKRSDSSSPCKPPGESVPQDDPGRRGH